MFLCVVVERGGATPNTHVSYLKDTFISSSHLQVYNYKYSPESHQMFQKYIVRIIRTSQMEFLCKGIVQDYNGYLALRLETI